ncbi:MAG: SRPBCC domain-containing protein [Fluviicola sp.]|nr:SRPBCC domain-containing protein [Fluviicola sp.]
MIQTQLNKATTVRKTFSRTTSISTEIVSDPGIIWALLTNASDFSRWNSTITSLEGKIELGKKIQLRSILDAKRVFKLSIKEMVPENRLTWGDAMGKRTFTLVSIGNGLIRFTMIEKIGGPLFPLFAGMIPSFDASFEQFAADLKKESETIMNAN